MARSHRFGIRCEQLAARHLAAAGWCVTHRNYRFGHREIDLIARRGDLVAFVEVKGRTGSAYGHPLAAVTLRKRREIERVARQWVARFGRPGDVYRFDAIAVRLDAVGAPLVDHVPDAWRLGS